jgi:CelD/BcsL family acetyltransferase involved in cellulose biosynthesis
MPCELEAPAGCRVTTESLDQIESEWLDLLAITGVRSPFLQPAWQRVWWQDLPPAAEPLFLAVRDGAQLLGIAPLLRQDERLALAGDSEICDYMDIVCKAGAETEVLDAVLREVESLPWQRFVFWGMRADSPTLPALRQVAEHHRLELAIEQEAVCPRVQLAASWEEYLEGLSKKDRHELRRKIRRFTRLGGEIREYAIDEPSAVRAALDDFFHLHTISRADKAEFMTPEMQRFFRDMVAALAPLDLIRLYFLELEATRVASVLAFNCGEELWLYNSGFDPRFASASVGLVSKAFALKAAIAEGKCCYDFLRGHEPYKYDLGGRDLEVLRCTLTRPIPSLNLELPHAR